MSQPQKAEPLHIVVSRAAKVPLAAQIHAAQSPNVEPGPSSTLPSRKKGKATPAPLETTTSGR